MKHSTHISMAACLTLATTLAACSNAGFTSSSGAGGDGKSGVKDARAADDGDPLGSPDADVDAAAAGADGGGGDGTDSGEAGADGSVKPDADSLQSIKATEECLKAKADSYNIALVFDNSGSQLKTDPQSVRRTGALLFVDQFAQYLASNPLANIYMVSSQFNQGSIPGQYGWLKMSDANLPKIKGEIEKATTKPNGGTAYTPALQLTGQYFDQIAATISGARVKNYVVFLTDGYPENNNNGAAEVDKLAANHDVAVIAIASGADIKPEGEQVVKNLAKPLVGTTDKSHVGRYYRAKTAAELTDVWADLFKKIGKCD